MATVFISYKREDAGRARVIVEGLRAENLQVWWDQGVGAGAAWRREIQRALSEAGVVVPLWSETSVNSDWVLEEAEYGKSKGILCPAIIDEVSPPIGFGGIQAANLAGWDGDRRDPAWHHFVQSIEAVVAQIPRPERKPSRPRKPMLPVLAAVVGAVAATFTIVGALDRLGIVRIFPTEFATNPRTPTLAESSDWHRIRQSRDCVAIAGYLRQNPGGSFAQEAQSLLAAKQDTTQIAWTPFQEGSWTT
ncbi:MAG: toll/interleukin-1 receptor domain-containing protein, partial [Proteobacteria bacterium]|nr:toll/interleukin-1 receptor domain-containing protein [Pseudomonadota bacterium]